ncbi:MAG: lactonase family protein [Terracidiphilus sp.]
MRILLARLAVVSLPVFLVAGCGGVYSINQPEPVSTCVPTSTPEPEYAYVLTGYSVHSYTVNSCGEFTATTPPSVAMGYSYPQWGAEQMVVDPLGRFAYVANLVSNTSDDSTISMYTINSATGVLTPTTPPTIPTGFFPQGIAIDPQGRFVYTANSDDNTVSMFTVNPSTGVLTPTTPPTVSTGTGSAPGFVTIDPAGKFAYVSNQDNDTVSMFTINQSTGVLTPTTPATVPTLASPFAVTIDPTDSFAYVPDAYSSVNGISEYTVNSTTGVLTPVTPSYVTAGNEPTAVAVDPTGKYAYVANQMDDTVSMFTINPTSGILTANGTIETGNSPVGIGFDTTGKYLYVTNQNDVEWIYTVNSDGTLTEAGSTGPGNGAYSTAFAPIVGPPI